MHVFLPLLLLLATLTACTARNHEPDEPGSDDLSVPVYPDLPELNELIQEAIEASHVSGLSACIVRNEETLWCRGFGLADREAQRPVTPQTPFMLASVSKTITGVAVMQLVESGELELDDPINDYLDFSVEHPNDGTPITPRMLMSHSAGIDDNWGAMGAVIVDGDSPIALGDFLAGYLTPGGAWYSSSLNFIDTGVLSTWHYSNIGVALLGYLVEVVSGRSFSTYCSEHIFEPLRMTDTGWRLAELDEDTLAVPYQWSDDDWQPIEHYGYPDYPDGALRTGAEQLASFLSMFANAGVRDDVRILAEDTVDLMQTVPYPQLNSRQSLIWYSWNFDGVEIMGHNGGDAGVSTEVGLREDGTGFVVLMNGSGDGDVLPVVERALLEAADTL